jgi:predicted NUDIX family NTP pyrophosphohydrolase
MAARESAGLLMYRRRPGHARIEDALEVLLAHPGGPFWSSREDGAWTIPKGGIHPGEDLLETARREFVEETGFEPCGPFLPLGRITQRSGKVVHAWAFEGDCDPGALQSVMTTTEWPPRSGKFIDIPEIDRLGFFDLDAARRLINVAQVTFFDRLVTQLTKNK